VAGDVRGAELAPHLRRPLAQVDQVGPTDGEDGGLGVDGLLEVLLGALHDDARDVELEDLVCLGKDLARGGRCLGDAFAHAGVLRALAGKDERELRGQRLAVESRGLAVEDSPRRVERALRGVFRHSVTNRLMSPYCRNYITPGAGWMCGSTRRHRSGAAETLYDASHAGRPHRRDQFNS